MPTACSDGSWETQGVKNAAGSVGLVSSLTPVAEDSKPAEPRCCDGGSKQSLAAALTPTGPEAANVHGDIIAYGVCWLFVVLFFFSSLFPLFLLYWEGCYWAKIKCLSITAFVCVNYSCGSKCKMYISSPFCVWFFFFFMLLWVCKARSAGSSGTGLLMKMIEQQPSTGWAARREGSTRRIAIK